MPVAVYVDILLVLNFIINYLLLRVTTLITGKAFRWWRLCVAAAIGALSALIIFFPYIGNLYMTLYKLGVIMLMAVVAFGFKGYLKWIIDVGILFAVSFIFSGAMLALYLLSPNNKMLMYNGVVYFDITAVSLLAAIVAGYVITLLLARIMGSKHPKEQICTVMIVANGAMVSLRGLIDTGNSLTEPFSGLPVIVAPQRLVERILPEEMKQAVGVAAGGHIRIIPFHSIGGGGMLMGFKPELVKLVSNKMDITVKDVYIGVSAEGSLNGEYDAIVNPTLLRQKG